MIPTFSPNNLLARVPISAPKIVEAFTFSALGMLVAVAAKDMPTANISLTALRLPMIFISGVFMPIQAIPFPLRVVSYLAPLTYMVDAMRESMTTLSITFTGDIAILLTWFIVLQALAVVVLSNKTQF